MLLVVVISMVLVLCGRTPVASSKNLVHDPQDHRNLERFKNALERDGFDVGIGLADTMDWAQEYCDGNRDDAGYVNRAPYLRVLVPESAQITECSPDGSDCGEIFQLQPDEAIVLIGLTPPTVNYFAYHTCLWDKTYPDGTRPRIFATLGDTVNNATINTVGPTPFNTPVALIFTPDRTTDSRVRAALRRAGFPAAMINTLVFPASMLNLGFDEGEELHDTLRIPMRIGKWQDPEAGTAYLDSISETLHVFRVTPRESVTPNPFPVPPLRVRGTGQTEMNLMNTLDRLRERIVEDHPGMKATDIHSKPNWYEGYDYIQQERDPGGDSRDAFFLSAGYLPEYDGFEEITLADDEFLMVYGVNHVATGKATYMSVNVYASKYAKLSINQVFDDDLAGTAWTYLAGDPAADLFYAYKISRNCNGDPDCLPLSSDPECPPLVIDSDTILGLIFRMYLEPATSVGAAQQEVLYDRILKFSHAD
jgi:hypothetical protein